VLVEAQAQQERLAAAGAPEALMRLLLLLAKLMMEVQDLHPLAMADCLARAIAFFHAQVCT